ncbi:hypothetical protein OQA88_4676 [Cercophora sp. LCS_1]
MSGSQETQNTPQMETDPDYKTQLDEAASRRRQPEAKPEKDTGAVDAMVENVSQYVPVVGKMLGKQSEPEQPREEKPAPGPPNRPDHDTQIEEFVRDQHRSTPITSLEK